MLTIIEDTRQKIDKHKAKHEYWEENGVGCIRCALPFGDYVKVSEIYIDTKQDIFEIGYNMCGSVKEKRRFAEECKLARDAGAKLIFLIEDQHYKGIEDLYGKKIHLHNGVTVPGDQLATAMNTMSGYYGCEFRFCKPEDAGQEIKKLLETNNGE